MCFAILVYFDFDYVWRGLDYIIYSQPDSKNYRHDWPVIDLHQKIDSEEKKGHVCLISPQKTNYISEWGWMCLFCQRRTLGKCYRHRCAEFKWKNCFGCNRIMRENVLIYKDTEKMYCDKLDLEKTIKKPTQKRSGVFLNLVQLLVMEHLVLNVMWRLNQVQRNLL